MKIKINLEELVDSLQINEKVVTKSINFPIIANVLLETNKSKVKISTTDLELNVTTEVNSKIFESGKLCIGCKELLTFLLGMPDKEIELKNNNFDGQVISKNHKALFRGVDPNNFPVISDFKESYSFKLNERALKKALSQTYKIVSIIETRPEISGFLFKPEEKKLKVVATDSFRLGEKIIEEIEFKNKSQPVILPLKAGIQLLRVLKDLDEEVEVKVGQNQIQFILKNIVIHSRLIEGNFPDYEKIIPHDFKTKVLVERAFLEEAIKKISLFSSKINDIKLEVKKSTLEVFSQNQETGEGRITLECEKEGDDLRISFNWKYLLDGVSEIDTDKVILNFVNKEKPLLIRPLDDSSYLYLAMPVREV